MFGEVMFERGVLGLGVVGGSSRFQSVKVIAVAACMLDCLNAFFIFFAFGLSQFISLSQQTCINVVTKLSSCNAIH